MKVNIISLSLLLTFVVLASGCKNKRISYTDMIKRETKEINAFMDKKGFKVVDGPLPIGSKMLDNHFVELTNEVGEGLGVWVNIVEPGASDDMAVSGQTPILARFSYEAIGERMKGEMKKFSNIGPTETARPGVTFIFQDDINLDYNRVGIQSAPNSTAGEEQMLPFACNAMMLALKYVPIGSTIKMITSFREGPSFTFQSSSAFANDNDTGVALYYDQIKFMHKR